MLNIVIGNLILSQQRIRDLKVCIMYKVAISSSEFTHILMYANTHTCIRMPKLLKLTSTKLFDIRC